MEDYKKKHKEDLEEAKGWLAIAKENNDKIAIQILEKFFPELKESEEDEKIRKALIDFVEQYGYKYYGAIARASAISWLERQGERKPAWSEEDESNLQGIVDEIETNKHSAPDYDLATYDRFLSWLKSLKERYSWKPTDEQMEALKEAMRLYKSTHFDSRHYKIETLYEDLKKLKGE